MEADGKYKNAMGQRNHPSFVDLLLLNLFYNCEDSCDNKIKCEFGGYQNPKKCERCVCPSGFGGSKCQTYAGSTSGCGGIKETSTNAKLLRETVGGVGGAGWASPQSPAYTHAFTGTTRASKAQSPDSGSRRASGSFGNTLNGGGFVGSSGPVPSNRFVYSPGGFGPPAYGTGGFHPIGYGGPGGFRGFHPGGYGGGGVNFMSFRRRRKRGININKTVNYGFEARECHYHLKAPSGMRIRLNIKSITASHDLSCEYGYVEIKAKREKRNTGMR